MDNKFNELIASLAENGGEYPETFLDDASAAYTEDMGIVTGKVEALTAELEALRAENLALKSHNYDLITAGAQEPEPEPGESGDGGEGDDDGEGDDESLDDLYEQH